MNSVRHLTLLSDTGLMLFHMSHSHKQVDEVLLSGFTGAITAIAEQLGDRIHTIQMKNQSFYLHHFDDFIILLATDITLEEEYVLERLGMLEHSSNLITMGREDNLEKLIEANNELHLEIAELFEMDSDDQGFDFDDFEFEDDNELFAEVLKELDSLV